MNLSWLLPLLAFCGVAFFVIVTSSTNARRSAYTRFKYLVAVAVSGCVPVIVLLLRNQAEGKLIWCAVLLLGIGFVTYSAWKLWPQAMAERRSLHQKPSPENTRQTFLWQGILILLPVFALAVVAIISLRWDRAEAERDARESALRAVVQLSDATAKAMIYQSSAYSTHKWIWEEAARWEARTHQKPNTPKDYWGEGLEKMPLREIVFDLDGNLLSPQPFILPEPPKWFTTLPAKQRALWDEATSAELTDSKAAERAFTRLIATSRLPEDVRENISFKLRRLQSTASNATVHSIIGPTVPEGVLTETGLPLKEMQLLRALQLRPSGWGIPETWKERFAEAVYSQRPSLLAPELLREGERISANDSASRSAIRALRLLWEANQRTVPLAEKLLEQHPISEWTNNAFWIETAEETFLLSIRQKTNAAFHNPVFFVRTFPKSFVEEWLRAPTLQGSSSIPPYADAVAEIDGQIFPLGRQTNSLPTNETLLAEVTMHADASDFNPPMKLRLLLTRPELLYARQKQRAAWAAGLISLAACAALVGFVTAHRSFTRQLRLNEMKDNFVSSVSHELRAPLASVRLMAEALEREKVTEAGKQKEYFKFIGQECRRLSSLVENVLDFSRIEQGRKQYEFEPLDVNKLLTETFKLMLPYAAERSVALRLAQLPNDCDQPSWDGRAIQQAIINLIDNAIKHSSPGQEVIVSLTCQNESPFVYRFSVKDSGPGIPASEQVKIFDRFYRLGSELRRETQGIGIGLSIVKHIVEGHGGQVLVRSEPGKGSTFTIELPEKAAT